METVDCCGLAATIKLQEGYCQGINPLKGLLLRDCMNALSNYKEMFEKGCSSLSSKDISNVGKYAFYGAAFLLTAVTVTNVIKIILTPKKSPGGLYDLKSFPEKSKI